MSRSNRMVGICLENKSIHTERTDLNCESGCSSMGLQNCECCEIWEYKYLIGCIPRAILGVFIIWLVSPEGRRNYGALYGVYFLQILQITSNLLFLAHIGNRMHQWRWNFAWTVHCRFTVICLISRWFKIGPMCSLCMHRATWCTAQYWSRWSFIGNSTW